jgi:pyruvate/2-oxoglutarate dehydrogenase complex dihydrolipoamide dehydrogenase (E3) component
VGLSSQDAETRGIDLDTFVQSMSEVDRSRADGETRGFVKVHVQKGTDKILGATVVGRHAGELISELTLAITAGVGLKALASVIHPYPTQAEAIKKVADSYNRTRLTPTVKGVIERWLAWSR